MKLHVVFFAALRDQIGYESMDIDVAESKICVVDVVESLCANHTDCRAAFDAQPTWQVAINRELADPQSPVRSNDEVAFFPPFSGG